LPFAREVADVLVFMRDGVGGGNADPAKDVIDHPQHAATQAFLARFHDKSLKCWGQSTSLCEWSDAQEHP